MILNNEVYNNRIKEPKPNSKVWRYMDCYKFIDLISTSKLFFVRIDKLADKSEAEITQNIIDEIYDRYKNIKDFYISLKEAEQRSIDDIKHIEKYKQYILVNCWSQNTDESYALWKIYLGSQPFGVSIQTKYNKLKNSLIDNNFRFLLQKVYYSKKVKDEVEWGVHYRKNKFYKFENEIRIAIFGRICYI